MKYVFLLSLALFSAYVSIFAQSVGINTTSPHASAALDVTSTTMGVLVPRMTQAQRDSIASPAISLLIYQTDGAAGFYFYNGANWLLLNANIGAALDTNYVSKWNGSNLVAGQIYDNGTNIGIGANNPAAKFHLNHGVLLHTGDLNTDSSLTISGTGTRMFFYPKKGVFRAGVAFNNNWDDDSLGFYSTAMGFGPKATGIGSVALGYGNQATQSSSTATGFGTLANGFASFSSGNETRASGMNSFAANFKTVAKSINESVFGQYNTDYTPIAPNNFGSSTDRLFTIGNGSSNSNRSDAFMVLKNGNVGVGLSIPSEKLEVAGKTKTTNLQVTTGAANGYILQSDANGNATWVNPTALNITENDPQVSSVTTNKVPKWDGTSLIDGQLFDNGTNIGIGTTNPLAKFEVNGGVRVNEGIVVDANGANNGTNLNTLSFGVSSGEAIGSPRTINSLNKFGLNFYTNNQVRMTIAHWGGVGINTEEAINNLDVNGGIAIGGDYAGIENAPNDGLIVQGNVGIGTNAPSEKLEVNGKIKANTLRLINGAANSYLLTSDSNGNATWTNPNTISFTETDPKVGSLSTNYVPKWNGTSLSNGKLIDDGTNVGIGMINPSTTLSVSMGNSVLDISFSTSGGSADTGTSPNNYQTISNVSGVLTKVSLAFLGTAGLNLTRTLRIYAGGSGTSGTLLATSAPVSFNIPVTGVIYWIDFTLLTPIVLNTGQTYSINIDNQAYWVYTNLNPYPNGSANTSPTRDFVFRTYLEGDGFHVSNAGVGIGTSTPTEKLDVVGKTKTVNFQLTSGASNGYVLKSDANGNATWVNSNTLTITETDPKVGALNTNYTPRWNGTILTNGQLFDNGTNVGVGTNNPQQKLSISGGINIDQAEQNIATLANGLSFGSNSGEGIASNRAVAFGNPDGLDFYTNHAIRFSITNSGRVGIGTVEPDKAKFEVLGVASNTLSYGYLNGSGNVGTASGTSNYSIYASNRIAASEFNAFSDARIKRVIGVSDKNQDLQTLLNIEIVDYSLIDSIGKGNNNYKKVIAQQVKEVYPQIVSTHVDVIPDIYQVAIIQDGFVALPNTNLKAGEKVKLIFEEGETLTLVKAINEQGFFVELPKNGKVFVYGREVKDFHTVDYEGLSTLNISATQALFKQVIELENNVKNMQHTLNLLQTEVQNIQSTHHSILSKN